MKYLRLFLSLSAVAAASSFGGEVSATAEAMKLAREGAAASEEKDFPAYLTKMEAAAALRPDFPRILTNLAAAQLANDRADDAIATLRRLAALGVFSPVDKAEAFAAIRDRKDFKDVFAKIANNQAGIGDARMGFLLEGMTGLVEGIAWREKTGDFFFGDVHLRTIWLRTKDNKVRRFAAEDENLFGVFGLAIDEEHGALWAATSAVPAMCDYTDALDGAAGIAEFDLETGALRRVVRVPNRGDHQTHVIGDLALAPDGGIFLPDSGAPVLWRLAPGATEVEVFAESAEFLSLQGAVVVPELNAVFVADHASGLLRVDLSSREVRRLDSPSDTTLVGLDGLVRSPGGDLVAVQNGLKPTRVLRLALDASGESVTAVTVLESGHLNMPDPTLGCFAVGGEFFFVGNAGWGKFEGGGTGPTPPRPVPIFRTKLAAPPPKKK